MGGLFGSAGQRIDVDQQIARLNHEIERKEWPNNSATARRGDIDHQAADTKFHNRVIATHHLAGEHQPSGDPQRFSEGSQLGNGQGQHGGSWAGVGGEGRVQADARPPLPEALRRQQGPRSEQQHAKPDNQGQRSRRVAGVNPELPDLLGMLPECCGERHNRHQDEDGTVESSLEDLLVFEPGGVAFPQKNREALDREGQRDHRQAGPFPGHQGVFMGQQCAFDGQLGLAGGIIGGDRRRRRVVCHRNPGDEKD